MKSLTPRELAARLFVGAYIVISKRYGRPTVLDFRVQAARKRYRFFREKQQ